MRPRPIVAWIGAASAAIVALLAVSSKSGGSITTDLLAANVGQPAAAQASHDHAAHSHAGGPAPTGLRLPGLTQSPWVQDRVAAAGEIWNLSPAARAWLGSYDLRQMEDRPAWFGSNGYDSWAGVGQAVPRIVMHEVSHSYWGAFPVAGRPELAGRRNGDGTSATIGAFRSDLETFLDQPPDRFEPLRDRFRHMPDLEGGAYPELYHAGEADLIYMTGGNIDLVPPILRKYVSGFFGDYGVGGGAFDDWAGALRWWNGLGTKDRTVAGQVFGLQHFPLDRYSALAGGPASVLSPRVGQVIAGEERQRLSDFADQFESLDVASGSFIDATGVDRGLAFWRRYLVEVRDLHERNPDVLRRHPGETGPALATAFDFYLAIRHLPADLQSQQYIASRGRPLVSDLAFMLKPATIVMLMEDRSLRPELVLASKVAVEEVPPGEVRAPEPQRMLTSAGVVETADVATLTAGVQRLTDHSSGNFMIDQPVDHAIYDILDRISQSDPRGVLQVFANSSLRLQPWIETHPVRAAATMRNDIAGAATLIEKANDTRSTDVSLLHALIAADPIMAADVLLELDRRDGGRGTDGGETATVVARTLNAIAYDSYWAPLGAGPRVDLAADAAFYSRLVQVKGVDWVERDSLAGMGLYRRAIALGEIEPEFASRHAHTLATLSQLSRSTDPASALLARLARLADG